MVINDLNEPPVVTEWRNNNFELIGSPEFSVEENSTGYFGTFRPSDPEGEEMVFSITDGFYISGYDKMYFSSTPDYERQSQFSPVLSISDGEFTTEYPLSISVIDIDDNNSPEFTSSGIFSVEENESYIGKVSVTDADGDSITFSLQVVTREKLSFLKMVRMRFCPLRVLIYQIMKRRVNIILL